MGKRGWQLADLPPVMQEQARAQMPDDAPKPKRGRPEGELQDAVTQLALQQKWLCYHTYRSDRSPAGFPDLVLLRGSRLVVAELKTVSNVTSPAQDMWLQAFLEAGAQTYIWTEDSWLEIERVLL